MTDQEAILDAEEIEELNEDLEENKAVQPHDEVLPSVLTIVPITKRPVFPGIMLPVTLTGEESLRAVKQAVEEDNGLMGLVLAKEIKDGNVNESELYTTGTVFKIYKVVPVAPDTVQVLGQGIQRIQKVKTLLVQPNLRWEVTYCLDPNDKPDAELKAYMMALSTEVRKILQLNDVLREQVSSVISQLNLDTPGLTMDLIASLLNAETEDLQRLLEATDMIDRAKLLLQLIKNEGQLAQLKQKINEEIKTTVDKQQKEFFLRQQLSAIKKELGEEVDDKESEVDKISKRLAEKDLPVEAKRVVTAELNKLKTLNMQSPEFNVTRSYLELIADLPWGETSDDNSDIKEARKVLDREHYGLDDVKNAILEFLSTVIRRGKVAGSIICLVGPPGVGKTSIGKSVAEALGRDFFRFSVGGMRDEAEIKGHRRTYIGAMPGKLVQALKRVGNNSPVIMLDEIDKIGKSYQGDPASALLEVLDPEQNDKFLDHYLDIPYDLSNVLFITTANQLDTIPGPLLDRMEIIRLSGYIAEEKVQIAKRYLVPKQLKDHGFSPDDMTFTEGALRKIVSGYAREAGVRNLEKQIRKIIRKVNLKMAESDELISEIDAAAVEEYLGKPVFQTERLYDKPIAGVVLGLAYTSFGGATLYIEANGIPAERGGLKLTGKLGDVMKESAQIAHSYVRSLLPEREPEAAEYFDKYLVHLHVPAGATPKDGPSAGVTMALTLYSLATDRPVRDSLAMTGELTLTGKVLPIGGVKEKTIAARRVNIKTLIFPEDNRRDFEELPDYIKEGLEVHFADYFDDVLKVAYAEG